MLCFLPTAGEAHDVLRDAGRRQELDTNLRRSEPNTRAESRPMSGHAAGYSSARYHGSRAYAAGSHEGGRREGFWSRNGRAAAPVDDQNSAYWGFH